MEQQTRVVVWGMMAAIFAYTLGAQVARLERPTEPGSHHVTIIVTSALTVLCSFVLMWQAAKPKGKGTSPSA